nr:GGDEF domain-containing protein [Jiella avicenniae]
MVAENHRLKLVRKTLLAALDVLPSPIFFKDRDGIYRAFNKAFATFFGKDHKDILGASAFDITTVSAAKTFLEADRQLLAEGGPQVYETAIVRADGAQRYVTFYKSVVRQEHGAIAGIIGAMIDVTDRKETEVRLREAADRDFLTGLPNRRHFLAHAEAQIAVNRSNGRLSYIAIGDLDRFKCVNDRHGHACGDAVLRHVSDILLRCLGRGNLVARAGGEEFFMMLDCPSFPEAMRSVEAVRDAIAKSPVDWDGERLWITASFGLTDIRADEQRLSSALARADEALYAAKRRGRNRVVDMETDFVADRGGI